jgi:phage tail-like protein
MATFYPPVGFHFRVEVLGIDPDDNDVRFADVGGLSAEMTTQEIAEGGQNRFLQKFPVRTKYPELVLKRGMFVSSKITDWIRKSIDDFVIEPHNIDVMLLNEKHEPLMTWHVINAYPTKWVVSDLSATNNAVVIETLQFFYQYFSVDNNA